MLLYVVPFSLERSFESVDVRQGTDDQHRCERTIWTWRNKIVVFSWYVNCSSARCCVLGMSAPSTCNYSVINTNITTSNVLLQTGTSKKLINSASLMKVNNDWSEIKAEYDAATYITLWVRLIFRSLFFLVVVSLQLLKSLVPHLLPMPLVKIQF